LFVCLATTNQPDTPLLFNSSNTRSGYNSWQILILFMALFVVNHAMQQTGPPAHMVTYLTANGFDLNRADPLFVAGFLLAATMSGASLRTATTTKSVPALSSRS
jgi:di/tricarboxylate transporter